MNAQNAWTHNLEVAEKTAYIVGRRVYCFLPRCMQCTRGLAMRILSVRLSVCPSVCLPHACIVTKR